jgi:hypothetical protein
LPSWQYLKCIISVRTTHLWEKGKDLDPEPDPYRYLWLMDPDPGGPKTCGSCKSRSGSGSPTLPGHIPTKFQIPHLKLLLKTSKKSNLLFSTSTVQHFEKDVHGLTFIESSIHRHIMLWSSTVPCPHNKGLKVLKDLDSLWPKIYTERFNARLTWSPLISCWLERYSVHENFVARSSAQWGFWNNGAHSTATVETEEMVNNWQYFYVDS